MTNPMLIGTTDILVRSKGAKSTAGTLKNVPPVHSWAASSQCELDSAWNHRRPWQVQKLTSLSIFEREFLLCKNVAITWNHRRPWRFWYVEHLLQKRHGCRWLYQKRCFGGAETRHQKCTRMYTFDDATTQIPAYLQKVYTLQKAAISNIIVPW